MSTEGPSWGHSKVVLGAIRSFLKPFCGHLSPKIDKVSEESTLRYPHEEPCVWTEGCTDRSMETPDAPGPASRMVNLIARGRGNLAGRTRIRVPPGPAHSRGTTKTKRCVLKWAWMAWRGRSIDTSNARAFAAPLANVNRSLGFNLIHYTHMQLSSWNGVIKSNSRMWAAPGDGGAHLRDRGVDQGVQRRERVRQVSRAATPLTRAALNIEEAFFGLAHERN